MLESFENVFWTLLVAVATSWVTVRLSLNRFRSERWWERKADAYAKVIEALHHAKEFPDRHLEAEYEGREVSKEADRELRTRSKEANAEVRRVANVEAFLLSDEAMARLRRFQEEEAKAGKATTWYEYLDGDWAAVNSCLKDLIEIAKVDLKVKSLLVVFLGRLFRKFRRRARTPSATTAP